MPAATFDNMLYICLACHKNISKRKIPCQAVRNKLEVEAALKVLQDLRFKSTYFKKNIFKNNGYVSFQK